MPPAAPITGLPELLEQVHNQLLPELRIHCPDPHDPVQVQSLPAPLAHAGLRQLRRRSPPSPPPGAGGEGVWPRASGTRAGGRGLHAHDVHGRNVMHHQGRGVIVDISDFLNPEACRAWNDLRLAYRTIYRPLIAPLRLRIPGAVLDGVRRSYRLIRRLRRIVVLRTPP